MWPELFPRALVLVYGHYYSHRHDTPRRRKVVRVMPHSSGYCSCCCGMYARKFCLSHVRRPA